MEERFFKAGHGKFRETSLVQLDSAGLQDGESSLEKKKKSIQLIVYFQQKLVCCQ